MEIILQKQIYKGKHLVIKLHECIKIVKVDTIYKTRKKNFSISNIYIISLVHCGLGTFYLHTRNKHEEHKNAQSNFNQMDSSVWPTDSEFPFKHCVSRIDIENCILKIQMHKLQ